MNKKNKQPPKFARIKCPKCGSKDIKIRVAPTHFETECEECGERDFVPFENIFPDECLTKEKSEFGRAIGIGISTGTKHTESPKDIHSLNASLHLLETWLEDLNKIFSDTLVDEFIEQMGGLEQVRKDWEPAWSVLKKYQDGLAKYFAEKDKIYEEDDEDQKETEMEE